VTTAGGESLVHVGSGTACPGLSQLTLATFLSAPRRVPSARQRMVIVRVWPAGMVPKAQLKMRGLFSSKVQAAQTDSSSSMPTSQQFV
jgi:hypothetical protein